MAAGTRVSPPARGEDKLGYTRAKWIARIELSDDPSYRGTWERRGTSVDAALKNRTAPERNPVPAKAGRGA
jgi:DMSO/TMAO reductase YedYZ molybdopterin-dependent catalytic subunit